jgi:hypothetical protein
MEHKSQSLPQEHLFRFVSWVGVGGGEGFLKYVTGGGERGDGRGIVSRLERIYSFH